MQIMLSGDAAPEAVGALLMLLNSDAQDLSALHFQADILDRVSPIAALG